jgi:hypothetical protein
VGATGTHDGDRKVLFRSALGVVPLWMLFLLVAADGGGIFERYVFAYVMIVAAASALAGLFLGRRISSRLASRASG